MRIYLYTAPLVEFLVAVLFHHGDTKNYFLATEHTKLLAEPLEISKKFQGQSPGNPLDFTGSRFDETEDTENLETRIYTGITLFFSA